MHTFFDPIHDLRRVVTLGWERVIAKFEEGEGAHLAFQECKGSRLHQLVSKGAGAEVVLREEGAGRELGRLTTRQGRAAFRGILRRAVIDSHHFALVVKRLVPYEPVWCLNRDGDNLSWCGLSTGLIILGLGWKSKSTHAQFPLIEESPLLPH